MYQYCICHRKSPLMQFLFFVLCVGGQFLYLYKILINTDSFISWYFNCLFSQEWKKNAQNIADDKNNVKSSDDVEIVHLIKRATKSHQVEKRSAYFPLFTIEQLSLFDCIHLVCNRGVCLYVHEPV
jgi:hypothetical protein